MGKGVKRQELQYVMCPGEQCIGEQGLWSSLETPWYNYRLVSVSGRLSSVPSLSLCTSVLVCLSVHVAWPEEQLGQFGAAITLHG